MTQTVSLTRLWHTPFGTFGVLAVGAQQWPTVERRADGPHPRIPAGVYTCDRGLYYSGDGPGGRTDYPCWIVQGVPGRSEIKIHAANTAAQLLGCIAPGTELGCLDNAWAVLNSRAALAAFMAATAQADHVVLTVTDEP